MSAPVAAPAVAPAAVSAASGFMGYSPMTILLVILLLVVLGMVAYKYMQKPKSDEATVEHTGPVPEAETK